MKSTTFAISSAALFYLTSAFPLSLRQANQINIVLQTGDGDSSQSFNIDIGQIVPTSVSGGSSGVDASISTAGVTCQAFSDAAGATPLDGSFTSASTIFFNDCAKDGQATSCVLADAVNIGAYCCAEDAAFNAACLANVKSSSTSSTSSTTSTSTSTSSTSTSSTSSTSISSAVVCSTTNSLSSSLGSGSADSEL
jgi:hypothetical protein